MADHILEEADKNDLHVLADQRFKNFLATQKTIPWAEASAHLDKRAAGNNPSLPQPQQFVP
ncbi:hypothetical protein GTP58_00420 [Duganella sp. CY15W]|uniref:hypothetical protein n=1 Tax=Duganella sp. CY15W TaxID=2692172 RepID=UPI0013720191|nr:hypothetical protein [Duganella sp. CY15W]MYM26781.1 hypothetical protein [Duganella sp. CY15W]